MHQKSGYVTVHVYRGWGVTSKMSQMDMWPWSFLGPPEQWESDYTPSNRPRNSNTRGQLTFKHLINEGKWEKVITSCCIKLPIVDANSNFYGKSSLNQLFVLNFHHDETRFLQNREDRVDPLAIRNGIRLSHCLRVSQFQYKQPLAV